MESNSRKPTAKNTRIMKYLITPELSPFGPNKCKAKPQMPLDWRAQISQSTMKTSDMAEVMLRSALPPRKTGRVTSKPLGVETPQPTVPTPGIKPNQLVNKIKMKIVAKNQKVFRTRSAPIISPRKPCNPSTSHSQKFWAPSGTSFMCRVAVWAKMIRPSATIQVTTIELVMGNPNG